VREPINTLDAEDINETFAVNLVLELVIFNHVVGESRQFYPEEIRPD
jgi:hypothetical protein